MDELRTALRTQCDLFAAIGTSGQVHPAADFAETDRARDTDGGAEPGADGVDVSVPRGPPRPGDGGGAGLGGRGARGWAA